MSHFKKRDLNMVGIFKSPLLEAFIRARYLADISITTKGNPTPNAFRFQEVSATPPSKKDARTTLIKRQGGAA